MGQMPGEGRLEPGEQVGPLAPSPDPFSSTDSPYPLASMENVYFRASGGAG